MITCPRCGYQAPDGTPYCPRCGYGRPPVQPNQIPSGPIPNNFITCPKCGLKLPPGSRFCSHCGYQFPTNQPSEKKIDKGSLIMTILGISLTVLGLLSFLFNNVKPKQDSIKTPTMSANQIMAAARATSEVLQQETEAPKLTKTAEYLLTPTRTPEPTLPPLCKDKQMDIIRIGDVLDVKGRPYPNKYIPKSNSCVYEIYDNDSFLGMNIFGYFTVIYDENDIPDTGIVEIYYKDNAETKELITDWGAIALAYIDDSMNALSASSTIRTIQSTGYGESTNCSIVASLDTDTMIYKYTIIKGTGLLDSVMEIFE